MPNHCSIEGCAAKHEARGLCKKHYQAQQRKERPEKFAQWERTRRAKPERKAAELKRKQSPRYQTIRRAWTDANPERIEEYRRRQVERRTPARLERERHRALRRMLQELERLAALAARPCNCQACRTHKARVGRTRRRNEKKGLILELKGRTCLACGGSFIPQSLHFHHLDPSTKLFNLSRGESWQYSITQIVAEAQKCIVVCFDCHLAIHHRGKPAPDGRQLSFL